MTTSDNSTTATPLSADELHSINAYWRACNYLAAGMIYLRDNPLIERTAQARTYQEPAVRALGIKSRPELCLHPHEPAHQQVRS